MLSVIYRDQLADVKMTDAFNQRVYNLGYRLAHLVDMVDVTYLHTICEICDNSERIYCMVPRYLFVANILLIISGYPP